MATIIVTGGLGFIGHHLIRELLGRQERVLIIDDLSNPNKAFFNELENNDETNKNFFLFKADVRDNKTVTEIFKLEKVETCIHLAAKISVNDSIAQPRETLDVNIFGTLNVLEACYNNSINNFIFASSSAVYGNANMLPIPEEHVIQPLSPYGASKAAGEALVSSYASRIKNCCILRFFNIYGEGQTEAYAGVITKFIERLSNHLPPIIYGNGHQTRDFVHISDVVQAIIAAKETISQDSGGLVNRPVTFNIGTGSPTSILQLACMLMDIFDLRGKVQPIHSGPIKEDITRSYADIRKAKKVLGLHPNDDLEAGLKKEIS